jgi:hypothetical protein
MKKMNNKRKIIAICLLSVLFVLQTSACPHFDGQGRAFTFRYYVDGEGNGDPDVMSIVYRLEHPYVWDFSYYHAKKFAVGSFDHDPATSGIIVGETFELLLHALLGEYYSFGLFSVFGGLELKSELPDISFAKLLKSGINIGKDIMGSMVNTLVLAYIGSSLTIILLLIVYTSSSLELFNMEQVIVEILQALVGSLGILLAMPLTALVCAAMYSQKHGGKAVENGNSGS